MKVERSGPFAFLFFRSGVVRSLVRGAAVRLSSFARSFAFFFAFFVRVASFAGAFAYLFGVSLFGMLVRHNRSRRVAFDFPVRASVRFCGCSVLTVLRFWHGGYAHTDTECASACGCGRARTLPLPHAQTPVPSLA